MSDYHRSASEGIVHVCNHHGDVVGDVRRVLNEAGLSEVLRNIRRILIKPNLVEATPPPVTTPVSLVAALVDYLQAEVSEVEIVIGEGCGSLCYGTDHCFDVLGYSGLAAAKGVDLLDLNHAPLTSLRREECRRWPKMHLPTVLFDTFLISVPVLKAHTLAKVTLGMKNMMGVAPPAWYQKGGYWKKSAFHHSIQEAVADLNRYRTPDFTLLDATVGLRQSHLGGPVCDPPPGRLAAGFDPVAVDAYGAGLLGLDWRAVGHIRMVHGQLGLAEPLKITTCA
jgi:uncharacterized protein (DUF362 family)